MSGYALIRLRRVPRRFPWGRVYEVEFTAEGGTRPSWVRVTRAPVPLIDPFLGVQDAWALVDAADEVWSGEGGGWSTVCSREHI